MAGLLSASPGVDIFPAPEQVASPSNYITNFDFLNQYLPDVYEQEFARYGDRSIASFLRMVSAEMPFSSDLLKWTEQGRLHTVYQNCSSGAAAASDTATITVNDSFGSNGIGIRVGQTVHLYDMAASSNAGSNKAIVTAVNTSANTFDVSYYEAGGQNFANSDVLGVYIYGSEFKKGAAAMSGTLESQTDFFDNSPIIHKDHFDVAGSDKAQIGWVEAFTEEGSTGYLWYLKSSSETRIRFEDTIETMLLEAVPAEAGSGVIALTSGDLGNKGSEGFFYVLENGGNVWTGGEPDTISDFDTIIKRLDKQGAISENVIFADRDLDFAINDMLAGVNGAYSGGTSYGMFNNSESMALELGFTGFRRAYDFYKTDWKYLNDVTMRGSMPDATGPIKGAIVPVGTTNVYDEVMGQSVRRPFLHVRYRKSETEDRKLKTTVTGWNTDASDKMNIDMLTERALCTLGRNNFVLIKGATA